MSQECRPLSAPSYDLEPQTLLLWKEATYRILSKPSFQWNCNNCPRIMSWKQFSHVILLLEILNGLWPSDSIFSSLSRLSLSDCKLTSQSLLLCSIPCLCASHFMVHWAIHVYATMCLLFQIVPLAVVSPLWLLWASPSRCISYISKVFSPNPVH